MSIKINFLKLVVKECKNNLTYPNLLQDEFQAV